MVVDGYAEMPGRGLPKERFGKGDREVWMEYGGGMRTIVGPGSVSVPGAIAAFSLAIEQFGRAPWSEVLQPAIDATASGFRMSGAAAEYLAYAHDAIFGWQPDSSAVVHRADGDADRRGRCDTNAGPGGNTHFARGGRHPTAV